MFGFFGKGKKDDKNNVKVNEDEEIREIKNQNKNSKEFDKKKGERMLKDEERKKRDEERKKRDEERKKKDEEKKLKMGKKKKVILIIKVIKMF